MQGIYRARTKDEPTTNNNGTVHILKEVSNLESKKVPKPSFGAQGDLPFSGPLEVPSSSGFAWVKGRKDDARSHSRSSSRALIFNVLNNVDSKCYENSRGSYELVEGTMKKQWGSFDGPDSFDASNDYHSQDLSSLYLKEHLATNKSRSHLVFIQKTLVIFFKSYN